MNRNTIAALLVALAAHAQTFEVASIKPRDIFKPDGRKFGFTISGNNVSLIGFTLHSLIMEAYGVESYQVTGGPSWADDSIKGVYEIDAKAEGDAVPSKEQARKMLQALLADRFSLAFHRETRDVAVYDLVVAKRGPKLTESPADAKFSNHQGNSRQAIQMSAVHETMDQFAHQIVPYTGRPVVDKTGLTKFYDFTFEFVSEGRRGPAADTSETNAASIFAAIEQQLGLKLDAQKRPTEVLIVDRAEKPTAN